MTNYLFDLLNAHYWKTIPNQKPRLVRIGN